MIKIEKNETIVKTITAIHADLNTVMKTRGEKVDEYISTFFSSLENAARTGGEIYREELERLCTHIAIGAGLGVEQAGGPSPFHVPYIELKAELERVEAWIY
ncbi:hypothetical protein [Photobacterium indicum]|uniref:Uncharacterized protein n=1 Tax=Photobacterium indicum TaxID=81447 RepID=A0A2T3L3E9_9GAMM|nr:hypothetical protein [Photobacterium indicum]PSV43620.1 hypothetical protein C9J47_22390 [Photobacterium indicum]